MRFFRRTSARIEREAAEWFFRFQDGLEDQEIELFNRWRKASRRHVAIFSEMQTASEFLDQAVAGARLSPADPGSRWNLWKLALPVALVFGLALLMLRWAPNGGGAGLFAQSVATRIGELRRLNLPDGSTVQINSDSAIAVRYTKGERRIRLLRGEAYFLVAKNPRRPFWVAAGAVSVRAVGTAFNVRFSPEEVDVLVTAGRVLVDTGRPSATQAPSGTFLLAGQTIAVRLQPDGMAIAKSSLIKASNVEPKAIVDALAWQGKRLSFSDTPLSEVVAEFNRYNKHKLVISDASLAAERFGGSFDSNRTRALIEVLEQNFGVVAEEHGNETVLCRRAK